MNLFAMAGLAEAAEAFATLIVIGGLGVNVLLFFIAVVKRSKIALVSAALLWCAIGWLLQPWHVFDGPESPSDPDEIYWIGIYRMLVVAWLITSIAAAFLLTIITKKRSRLRRLAR